MRKIICMIIIMILLTVSVPMVYGEEEDTIVKVDALEHPVSPGDTFILYISCIPAVPIKGWELEVEFDADLLQANSVTEGNIFDGYSTYFVDGDIDNENGTIEDIYGLIMGQGNVSEEGTFINISFTVQEDTGTSPINLTNVGVCDETHYVNIDVQNGEVLIEEYTLTIVTHGSGSVSLDPDELVYGYGDEVELTATGTGDWVFDYWTDGITGNTNPETITMYDDETVNAYFNITFIVNASTYDGGIFNQGTSYSSVRDAVTGGVGASATYIVVGQRVTIGPTNVYRIDRGYLIFDTSSVPSSAVILSSTVSMYGRSDSSDTNFALGFQKGVVSGYPHTPLQQLDYNRSCYGGNGGTLNTLYFAVNEYNDIELTQLSWIIKAGTTKLCLRSSRDVAGVTPTGNEYISIYSADDTTRKPKLSVTYTYT